MTDPADLRFPAHWVGAVYQAMCAAFEPDTIRAFWEDHTRVGREELPMADLLRMLMDRHATVPAAYDYQVTNALEPFLLRHGVDAEEFVKFASYMSSYHPFYSPEQILFRATKPVLLKLSALYDPRRAVIALLQNVASSITPEQTVRSVKKTGPRSHIITLRHPGVPRFPYEHDYHFYCRIQIVNAPSVFGYPPFTHWNPLSDARPVERCLLGGERVVVDGGLLVINSNAYGTVLPSFGRACRERFDLTAGLAAGEDCPVVLVERNYLCPVRKRVALTKGCLYGGPYYLAEIGYDPIPVEKEDYVRRLFTLVKNADREADKKVTDMHALLTSRAIRVVYSAERQRCEVTAHDSPQMPNPRLLLSLSGMEARILRYVVSNLARSGERLAVVPCMEIVRDAYGFGRDSKPRGHRSFYVSLKRLAAKVNRDAAEGMALRVVSHGRTKAVELTCPAGPVEYAEE
jgi:hypothetical protein